VIITAVTISSAGSFKSALKNGTPFSTEFDVSAILLTSLYKPSYSTKTKKPLRLRFRQQRNSSARSNALIFVQNMSTIRMRLRRPNGERLERLERYIILLSG
jgi:hypothetical protein